MLASSPICASVVSGVTTKTARPFPSWMAFGQSRRATAVTPLRSTSPERPSVMTLATIALQLLSEELGKPLKLQVQPGLQLQNSYPTPRSR